VKFNRFVLVSLAAVALLSGCGKSTSPTGVTSNNLDTTPPPTPDGMTVVVDSNSGRQQLVWSPSSAADLARYQVYIYSPDPSRDHSFVLARGRPGSVGESQRALVPLPGAGPSLGGRCAGRAAAGNDDPVRLETCFREGARRASGRGGNH